MPVDNLQLIRSHKVLKYKIYSMLVVNKHSDLNDQNILVLYIVRMSLYIIPEI